MRARPLCPPLRQRPPRSPLRISERPLPSSIRRTQRWSLLQAPAQGLLCASFSTSPHHPLPPLPESSPTRERVPQYSAEHLEIERRLLTASEWSIVKGALRELQSKGGILRLRAHQHAVESACAAGDVEEVQKLMSDSKDRGHVPTYQAFVAAIGLYRDNGLIDLAMEALELFQKTTPQFRQGYDARLVSSVISACGARDVFRAIKLFHNMLRAGVEPDARAYASIIYACLRGNRVRKAEEFLRDMLARNLQVESKVYTAVVSRMPLDPAVQETPSRTLSLVELMREHGHQPDSTLYTAIIRALSVHASHLPTALKLMEEMQERGLNPPTELCNAVIAGSLRHDPLQAEAIFERMLAGLAPVDQRTYSLLAEHYAKTGNVARGIEITHAAEKAKMPLLGFAFAALIDAAMRAKQTHLLPELKRCILAAGIDPRRLPLPLTLAAIF